MFTSRYSEMEMQQWHDASCASQNGSHPKDAQDKPRHSGARAWMAKGQAEKKQSRTSTAAMRTPKPKQDDWASECLFDCYNG